MIEIVIFIGGVAVIGSIAAFIFHGITKSFFLNKKLLQYMDTLSSMAMEEEDEEIVEETKEKLDNREFEWS